MLPAGSLLREGIADLCRLRLREDVCERAQAVIKVRQRPRPACDVVAGGRLPNQCADDVIDPLIDQVPQRSELRGRRLRQPEPMDEVIDSD